MKFLLSFLFKPARRRNALSIGNHHEALESRELMTAPALASTAAAAATTAWNLDQKYQFDGIETSSTNWGGQKEIWLKSKKDGWFYMLPNGDVYNWTEGTKKAVGTRVAQLGKEYFVTPQLLFQAKAPLSSNPQTSGSSPQTTAWNLDQKYGFERINSASTNWGGQEEVWLQSKSSGWFYMTPNGDLYDWTEGTKNAVGTKVASLGQQYFAQPSLLFNAQRPAQTEPMYSQQLILPTPAISNEELIPWQMDQKYEFEAVAGNLTNWGGKNEIWIQSQHQGWFYMTPDGNLFDWQEGSRSAIGSKVGNFGAGFYSNPDKLVNAVQPSIDWLPTVYEATPTFHANEFLPWSIDQTLGFDGVKSGWTNWGGKNEIWLQSDTNGWFYMTPDGSLYDWTEGTNGATGTRVAELGAALYSAPAELFNATEPTMEVTYQPRGFLESNSSFWDSIGTDYPTYDTVSRIGTTDGYGNSSTTYYDAFGDYLSDTWFGDSTPDTTSFDAFWSSIGADYPIMEDTYRIGTTDMYGNNTTNWYNSNGVATGTTSRTVFFDDNAPKGESSTQSSNDQNVLSMINSSSASSQNWSYSDDSGWVSGNDDIIGGYAVPQSWNTWNTKSGTDLLGGYSVPQSWNTWDVTSGTDLIGGYEVPQSWNTWDTSSGTDLFGGDSFWNSIGTGYGDTSSDYGQWFGSSGSYSTSSYSFDDNAAKG